MQARPPRRFDVVIPTYNNAAQLQACLEALSEQGDRAFSVIVCIDGSTDGTRELLGSVAVPYPLEVAEHPDRANHGRAAARNLALTRMTGEFVLLLDSDMRLAPDGLHRHRELLEARDCISQGDVIYTNAMSNLWARYLRTRGKNKAMPGAAIRSLDFATANTAMRREHFEAVGGFDERFVAHGGEDTELALRLEEERGGPFVFNAAARAYTEEPKSAAEGLAELREYGRQNLPMIRQRHPSGPAPFFIDRLESDSLRNRAFRALLNSIDDRLVDLLLPRSPFWLQRRLLNYKVIRAVFAGYTEAAT